MSPDKALRSVELRDPVGGSNRTRGSRMLLFVTLALAACSSGPPPPTTATSTALLSAAGSCDGPPALRALWRQERMAQPAARYEPVGPGDVLRVWVVGINELEDEEVQVSDSGTITLPYVGTIDVQGLGIDQMENRLDQAFAEYIRTPEVHVVMKEDRSQAVAVMGLVNKPELVPLAMPDETIMDVIGVAGGLTSDASQRVLLIPAAAEGQSAAAGVVPTSADPPGVPGDATNAAYQGTAAPRGQGWIAPIVVDLHSSTDQGCLDLPVRAVTPSSFPRLAT